MQTREGDTRECQPLTVRRLARVGYQIIARTPLRRVLRTRLAQRMKKRLVAMPADLVPRVMDALERGGVSAWLVGGWAVDALAGAQTRPHEDLDLVIDAGADGEQRATAALGGLGFHVMGREPVPSFWWFERIAMSDDHGHVVDLHPASLTPQGVVLRNGDGKVFARDEAFTTGTIAGRQVRCLSPRLQLALLEVRGDDMDGPEVASLRKCLEPADDDA